MRRGVGGAESAEHRVLGQQTILYGTAMAEHVILHLVKSIDRPPPGVKV